MPRIPFKAFQVNGTVKDSDVNRIQSNVTDALQPYVTNPLIDGRLIQAVALSAGANSINHGLGRTLIGWIQTRVRSVISYALGPSTPINLVAATGSPAFVSGTFTSVAGGVLILRCGISGFSSGGNEMLTITVQVDGNAVATSHAYATAANTTVTHVPFTVVLNGAAAGTHTVKYVLTAGTWDANIFLHCEVDEVGAAYALYDRQDANTTPDKTLNLFSSSAATADLWVF